MLGSLVGRGVRRRGGERDAGDLHERRRSCLLSGLEPAGGDRRRRAYGGRAQRTRLSNRRSRLFRTPKRGRKAGEGRRRLPPIYDNGGGTEPAAHGEGERPARRPEAP